jgi:hypothetical protein
MHFQKTDCHRTSAEAECGAKLFNPDSSRVSAMGKGERLFVPTLAKKTIHHNQAARK